MADEGTQTRTTQIGTGPLSFLAFAQILREHHDEVLPWVIGISSIKISQLGEENQTAIRDSLKMLRGTNMDACLTAELQDVSTPKQLNESLRSEDIDSGCRIDFGYYTPQVQRQILCAAYEWRRAILKHVYPDLDFQNTKTAIRTQKMIEAIDLAEDLTLTVEKMPGQSWPQAEQETTAQRIKNREDIKRERSNQAKTFTKAQEEAKIKEEQEAGKEWLDKVHGKWKPNETVLNIEAACEMFTENLCLERSTLLWLPMHDTDSLRNVGIQYNV